MWLQFWDAIWLQVGGCMNRAGWHTVAVLIKEKDQKPNDRDPQSGTTDPRQASGAGYAWLSTFVSRRNASAQILEHTQSRLSAERQVWHISIMSPSGLGWFNTLLRLRKWAARGRGARTTDVHPVENDASAGLYFCLYIHHRPCLVRTSIGQQAMLNAGKRHTRGFSQGNYSAATEPTQVANTSLRVSYSCFLHFEGRGLAGEILWIYWTFMKTTGHWDTNEIVNDNLR